MKNTEKEINKRIFDMMPEILYHGSPGIKYTKEDFINKIKIFKNIDEYNRFISSLKISKSEIRKYVGRTNLDGGFSGIYFTPNKEQAIEWATRFVNRPGQLITVKVNKKVLLENGITIHCIPTLAWARFIVKNRKKTTYENLVKCSYTVCLDSNLKNNQDLIEKIQKSDISSVHEFVNNMRHEFFKHYLNKNKWNFNALMKDINIINGKYFQLCISSDDLLKSIEVIDIIKLNKEEQYE